MSRALGVTLYCGYNTNSDIFFYYLDMFCLFFVAAKLEEMSDFCAAGGYLAVFLMISL